ncbi:MAG: hypothetical protein JXA89_00650 [Anaerolineae bacterium]|nr:hypothetical protein [Anaerolineae bacterium]
MPHPNQGKPVRVSMIRGEPITLYGRTMTPVARVTSGGGHEGTVRERRVEGLGWAFAQVKPLHIIEERNGETFKIPIPDVTGETLRKMAILSVMVAVVSMIFILIGYVRRT